MTENNLCPQLVSLASLVYNPKYKKKEGYDK